VFPAARSERLALRHGLGNRGGANLTFLDGHAQFFRRDYLMNSTSGREEKFLSDVIWNPNRDRYGFQWDFSGTQFHPKREWRTSGRSSLRGPGFPSHSAFKKGIRFSNSG
jgi:prepilin-type processing-associated H-X9-DG protein